MSEEPTEEHQEQPSADETVKPNGAGTDVDAVSNDSYVARKNDGPVPTEKGGRRRVLTMLAAALVLGILTIAGVAYATYDFKEEYDGKILPGASVAGVDVGGMTEAEAVKAVKKAIRPKLRKPITVKLGDEKWEVTPEELGARNNAKKAIKAALRVSEEASWTDLASMRLLGDKLSIDKDVSISHSKKGARAFIEGLEKDVQAAPVDAALDYSSGWVEITKEKAGRELAIGKSTRDLMKTLKGGETKTELAVRELEPEVTADSFDQVILVRQSDFRVYLYNDGKITHDWPIAIGMAEYPTPIGLYSVELKRYMPTWVNPSPDTWGKDMPATIPPGPENPLGVRAINWTAPAIRFHGTSATTSIGTRASHGCVRLLNSDIVEMYDLVEEGTPIVSVWG